MRKIIKSLGIVFGDIGTSPIYTLTVIFLFTKPTVENITGVLSLIVWTLMTLVTVEYAWLATSLSKKGEGGDIVLKEILLPYLKSGRKAAFVTLVHRLDAWAIRLIDCQVATVHLERFGAREVPRPQFLADLDQALEQPTRRGSWADPP